MIPPNPVYLSPDSDIYQLLAGAVPLGVSSSLMGQIIAAFPEDPPIPTAVLRYVFGPLLYHSQGKDDLGSLTRDLLDRWRPRVDLERLEILAGIRPDLVSPTELWLVMYNMVMTVPLQRASNEIVVWAMHRSAAAAPDLVRPELVSTHQGRLGPELLVGDTVIFDGRLTPFYVRMCREIIAKVIRHSPIRVSRRGSITTEDPPAAVPDAP